MTADEIAKGLAAPFSPDEVQWRVGSTTQDKAKGMALAYISARDVMHRLDSVVGPFGWRVRHVVEGNRTTCHLGIRNPETGEWIDKSDGAGDTDYEPEKGGYSDSLKRAAVLWQIGRYLYDVASPWVQIEQRGKSYIIKEGEYAKLRQMLQKVPGTPAIIGGSGGGGGVASNSMMIITPPSNVSTMQVEVWREGSGGPSGKPKASPEVSADKRIRLKEAMSKQKTRDALRQWRSINKIQNAIEVLTAEDWGYFQAEFQSYWNSLPETTILDGG